MISRVLVIAIALLGGGLAAPQSTPLVFDVRAHGAKGDGRSADTVAINAAIDAAAAAGGGVVAFPAGRYLTFSIRLKSHITLQFAPGAVLIAGDPSIDVGRYDAPEPNPSDLYQDFGHSHWQNSLIWGVDVEDVAIVGPGLIDGRGLTRRGPGARWTRPGGDRPLSMGAAVGGAADPEAVQRSMDGQGNKAIALKRARNVTLRDFAILNGGHFALLATGVDTLTIDNVRVDTNRDGFDIDASRNVRISNVAINSPNDDALVLKSSYALGEARPTENVTITNVQVSGFDIGTVLDGTRTHTQERAPDRDGVTGRIKLGTESNGGFRNITISNCVFEWSRGLALETVDGGVLEDVTVTNVTMRHVTTAPIFLRLGNRARARGHSRGRPPSRHHQQHRRIRCRGPLRRNRRGRPGASRRGRAPQQHQAPVSRRRYRGRRERGSARARRGLSGAKHVRDDAVVWPLRPTRQEHHGQGLRCPVDEPRWPTARGARGCGWVLQRSPHGRSSRRESFLFPRERPAARRPRDTRRSGLHPTPRGGEGGGEVNSDS